MVEFCGDECNDSSANGCLRPIFAILIPRAVCASLPEARAGCGKSARTDLCGGYGAIRIPTATPFLPVQRPAFFTARHTQAPEHPTYGSLRGPAMPVETDSGSTANGPSGIGKRFHSHAQRKTLPFPRCPGSPCARRNSSLAIGEDPPPNQALPASFGTRRSSGIRRPDTVAQVFQETANEGRIHCPLPAPDRGGIRLLPRRVMPTEPQAQNLRRLSPRAASLAGAF